MVRFFFYTHIRFVLVHLLYLALGKVGNKLDSVYALPCRQNIAFLMNSAMKSFEISTFFEDSLKGNAFTYCMKPSAPYYHRDKYVVGKSSSGNISHTQFATSHILIARAHSISPFTFRITLHDNNGYDAEKMVKLQSCTYILQ